MSDKLLMGTSRPLFRYESGSNIYRNVLNDTPEQVLIPVPFPEEEILNRGVFSPYKIWKTSKGFRMNCIVTFGFLDRPSTEKLLEIFESGNSFYMRPHFNFYKEYEVVCLNAKSALQRINTIVQPYQGALYFTAEENVTSHPISKGGFNFNGSTKIANTLASTLNGDCVVEMWIKTPASFSSKEELFSMVSSGVNWTVSINTNGTIEFITDDGSSHTLTSTSALSVNKWHFICISRTDTDTKAIYIDGVEAVTAADDSKAANAITGTQLGETSSGFSGLCQVFRIYNDSFDGDTQYAEHSIEAINNSYQGNIKLWWDFSQGDATDLSDEENDGTVTGTETYSKESFPDNGSKYLT